MEAWEALRDEAAQRVRQAFADVPSPTSRRLFQEEPYWIAEWDIEASWRWRRRLGGDWHRLRGLMRGYEAEMAHLAPDIWRYLLRDVLLDCLAGAFDYAVVEPSVCRLVRQGCDAALERSIAVLSTEQRLSVCDVLGLRLLRVLGNPCPGRALAAPCGVRPAVSQAALGLRTAWRQVDHWAVRLALDVRRRHTTYAWPRAQDAETGAVLDAVRAAFRESARTRDGAFRPVSRYEEGVPESVFEWVGIDWTIIHPDLLAHCWFDKGYLTPDALRSLIAAQMCADLLGLASGTDPVFHLTDGLFDAPRESWDLGVVDWRAHRLERLSAMTHGERQAIVAYLRHRAARDDLDRAAIEQALERYWLPALSGPDA